MIERAFCHPKEGVNYNEKVLHVLLVGSFDIQ
jgi:hypothetical protein